MLATSQVTAGPPSGGDPQQALLELGRRVYREGLLGSGQPVQAVVSGDVPVRGTQFTCVSCHQRSGMGSSEGWLVAPMVTAQALFQPRASGPRQRPAYTDALLARALRQGSDPGGRPLEAPMPCYDIPEAEMRGLIAYMKTLSAGPSPGVTNTELHFGTVVAGDVNAAPMLAVLETFFEERNRQTRHEVKRRDVGAFYRANVDSSYRTWFLHVWTLHGEPETWRDQLEEHYRKQPVFALLSGMASAPWRPVHRFCETHEIPCLLPNTDLAAMDEEGYYTVYLSPGMALEARIVARHVVDDPVAGQLIQVYRAGTPGAAAAAALRHARQEAGLPAPVDRRWESRLDGLPDSMVAATGIDALVLWLDPSDLATLEPALSGQDGLPRRYLSSTLAGGLLETLPGSLRDESFVVHPFALPDAFSRAFIRVRAWLARRDIPLDHPRLLAQTYFACMVAGDAKMHIKYDYFYRDFFLESIDHMSAVARYSVAHPKPSFGPGQRFLSKGGYLLAPGGGEPAWIVP